MNRQEYAELYERGWTTGDPSKIMRALADRYEFHNPRVGLITKSQFNSYFDEFHKMVMELTAGAGPDPFMVFEDQVTNDDGAVLTYWTWWRIPETKLQGAGLVKVTDEGVVSHRAAFHAFPQW